MDLYDIRISPDEEKKYSKEKEYSDFTIFLQSLIKTHLKEKTLFFNVKGDEILCYNKVYEGEIYNKIHSFFINSDKEKYTIMSLKINFDILVKTENTIHNIFKENMKVSSKNMLTYYSSLIKKIIQLLKKDIPAVTECYILYFENDRTPVLQRIFLKSEKE